MNVCVCVSEQENHFTIEQLNKKFTFEADVQDPQAIAKLCRVVVFRHRTTHQFPLIHQVRLSRFSPHLYIDHNQ